MYLIENRNNIGEQSSETIIDNILLFLFDLQLLLDVFITTGPLLWRHLAPGGERLVPGFIYKKWPFFLAKDSSIATAIY